MYWEPNLDLSLYNLPGFSALPGFKAPFHGDEQSALQPGTTLHRESIRLVAPYLATPQF